MAGVFSCSFRGTGLAVKDDTLDLRGGRWGLASFRTEADRGGVLESVLGRL